jgi:hypothetical protein
MGVERKTGNCEKVTKEVIEIHVLLTRSLFGGGIPQVSWAPFSSEIDLCSFAVLMASQNETSIWVSSAPIAARNTPCSRFIARVTKEVVGNPLPADTIAFRR